jgi:hypothetical protein
VIAVSIVIEYYSVLRKPNALVTKFINPNLDGKDLAMLFKINAYHTRMISLIQTHVRTVHKPGVPT